MLKRTASVHLHRSASKARQDMRQSLSISQQLGMRSVKRQRMTTHGGKWCELNNRKVPLMFLRSFFLCRSCEDMTMTEDLSMIPNILCTCVQFLDVLCCPSSECCCFRMQILGQPTATWKDIISCTGLARSCASPWTSRTNDPRRRYFYHESYLMRVAPLRRGQRC